MQHKLRRGDMLVVTKMDRLARSISRLLTIVEALKDKGVDLMILDFSKGESINTNSPSGKLMLTMFGAFAEFERSNMLEPQRAYREGQAGGQIHRPQADRDEPARQDRGHGRRRFNPPRHRPTAGDQRKERLPSAGKWRKLSRVRRRQPALLTQRSHCQPPAC